MLISTMMFLATAFVQPPQDLEEEEMALAEKVAVVEDKELVEDGELIFDEDEPVTELDEES